MTDIPLLVELGENGLYYGTSPAIKGLLVTGASVGEVMDKLPAALAEMRQAVEAQNIRNRAKLAAIEAAMNDYLAAMRDHQGDTEAVLTTTERLAKVIGEILEQ